jgi:outer membrane receptor protein involved in Fe transport
LPARALYALLTGRVNVIGDGFNGKLDEDTKKYSLNGTAIQRNRAVSFGFYVQDYFKLRPNLSLNMGVRWEPQLAPVHKNAVYIRPTFEGLFGISGPGNLFLGSVGRKVTAYVPLMTRPSRSTMTATSVEPTAPGRSSRTRC